MVLCGSGRFHRRNALHCGFLCRQSYGNRIPGSPGCIHCACEQVIGHRRKIRSLQTLVPFVSGIVRSIVCLKRIRGAQEILRINLMKTAGAAPCRIVSCQALLLGKEAGILAAGCLPCRFLLRKAVAAQHFLRINDGGSGIGGRYLLCAGFAVCRRRGVCRFCRKGFICRQIGIPHAGNPAIRSPLFFLELLSGTAPLLLLPKLPVAPSALLIMRRRKVFSRILLRIVRVLFPVTRLFLLPLQSVKSGIHRLVPGQLQNGSLRQNINTADAGHQQHQNRAKGLEQLVHGIGDRAADDAAADAVFHAPSVNGGGRKAGLGGHVRSEQLCQDAEDQIQADKSQDLGRNPVIVCLAEDIIQIPSCNKNRENIGGYAEHSEHKAGEKAPDDAKTHEIAQEQENHGGKQRNQRHIPPDHRVLPACLFPPRGGRPAPAPGGGACPPGGCPPGRRCAAGTLSCPCGAAAAARRAAGG